MINQKQEGDAVYAIAPASGFVSGNAYQVGAALFGVAGFSCSAGATDVLWLKGVFSLTKTSAQAWAVGDIIYWNNTTFCCDNTLAAGPRVGVATAAAANPSPVGEVRLDGILNPVTG